MDTFLREKDGQSFLETVPGSGQLLSAADALDLVATCGENGTQRLMLHASNLPKTFFDLKSGLLGAALLKFSNYRITIAAVLTPELVGQGHFSEFVLETNRGKQFRIFYERQAAEDWLLSL